MANVPIVEFYVMPLSRYWAEDYIHPAMRAAWAQGQPVQAIDAETRQVRTIAPNTPLGGPDAPLRRQRELDATRARLAVLPGARDGAWEESSSLEPRFHRAPAAPFAALMREAADHVNRGARLHLARANVFLPTTFDEPQKLDKDVYGSVYRLSTELRTLPWGPATKPAVEALLAATQDSSMLQLPLIIVK